MLLINYFKINYILKKGKRSFNMDKIKVVINDNQKEVRIPTGLRMIVRRACIAALKLEKFKGSVQVSVTFVNNEEIQKLNKQYRDKDCPTDVLSFSTSNEGKYDVDPETGMQLLGDVVISLEKANEQAEKYGYSLQQEIGFLTTHSVLHLLGYNHEQGGIEKAKMREREQIIMAQLGYNGISAYDANS